MGRIVKYSAYKVITGAGGYELNTLIAGANQSLTVPSGANCATLRFFDPASTGGPLGLYTLNGSAATDMYGMMIFNQDVLQIYETELASFDLRALVGLTFTVEYATLNE